jgi:RHS repeat-associated protein
VRDVTGPEPVTVVSTVLDGAGRPTQETRADGTRTFGWDAAGRLRKVSVSPAVAGPGGAPYEVTYGYDDAGLRVWKEGPAGRATWLWGARELVEETPAGAGAAAIRYTRLGDLAIAAGTERLLHDGMGSVVGRIGLGAAELYRYDAWGAVRGTSVPGADGATLAYAGQHWDSDVGLSYAQQRWYEPGTGRFLSEDPVFGILDDPPTLNAFAYASGNPLSYTDPQGTFKLWVHRVISRTALGDAFGSCDSRSSAFAVSNALTDIIHPTDSSRHCDASNLTGCMKGIDDDVASGARCLQDERCFQQKRVDPPIQICEAQNVQSPQCTPMSSLGNALDEQRLERSADIEAVAVLARASHALQDFYAHSNFIDLWHEFAPESRVAPTFSEVYGDESEQFAAFRRFVEERGIFSGNFSVGRDAAPETFGISKIPFVRRSQSPRHEDVAKDEPSSDPARNLLFEMAVDAARRETVRMLRSGSAFVGRERAPLRGGACE